MKYNKDDIINVATKLGRLANGGVVGYYAGGKTPIDRGRAGVP